MRIGYPKECKQGEKRFVLTPEVLSELLASGHEVFMQAGAGEGIHYSDEKYYEAAQGAHSANFQILPEMSDVYAKSEMIVMVKEPQKEAIPYIYNDHIVFSYLHLTGDQQLTEKLMDTGATFFAFETIPSKDGKSLPLLTPMSEIAGKQAVSYISQFARTDNGGMGKVFSDMNITVIGAGVAGQNALQDLASTGANVTVLDPKQEVRNKLQAQYGQPDSFAGTITIENSTPETIRQAVLQSDAVVDGVLAGKGKKAPTLITRELLKEWGEAMNRPIFVSISIDQGGIIQGAKPTSIDKPAVNMGTPEKPVLGIMVPNMPSLAALSASKALAGLVKNYTLEIANKGLLQAVVDSEQLRYGVNIAHGKITLPKEDIISAFPNSELIKLLHELDVINAVDVDERLPSSKGL